MTTERYLRERTRRQNLATIDIGNSLFLVSIYNRKKLDLTFRFLPVFFTHRTLNISLSS